MTPFMPIIHVVDDDKSFRVALARLLRAAGYEVQTYSSAGDFLLVRGKWDAPHWASCSGALRTGTAVAEQRTDGLQQHGANNWLAEVDAVGNPGRLLPQAVLVLRGDEDRRPGLARRSEMVE